MLSGFGQFFTLCFRNTGRVLGHFLAIFSQGKKSDFPQEKNDICRENQFLKNKFAISSQEYF
jgi:hypothetical protein